ncbi:hypothetical protein VY88_20190 [Azospirillum thiophilum]|uniref:Lipoyl-binding domain-containing protein n=1 Tax=Azospirillum thiophilum TaxID=528244 RepID=A0AAC8W3B8_9PROT|nr:biotin/lipoyl-binding carrier protein [Azospirillum thiophilum]ALG74354.1 hypothetical protein AL072_25780 [Azospirillum thiophilum]KJR63778.1 hypothetical protein VY88_20190 [Azospirillum thiophilum]
MSEIELRSDVTGSVWRVLLKEGDAVDEDQSLMILESMKMEIPLAASESGRIARILVQEGDAIREGQVVAVLEV